MKKETENKLRGIFGTYFEEYVAKTREASDFYVGYFDDLSHQDIVEEYGVFFDSLPYRDFDEVFRVLPLEEFCQCCTSVEDAWQALHRDNDVEMVMSFKDFTKYCEEYEERKGIKLFI